MIEETYEDRIVGLIASRTKGINLASYADLLRQIGRPGRLLKEPTFCNAIPLLKAQLLSQGVLESAYKDLRCWQGQGIELLVLGGGGYPAALANIFNPPLVLFYRGSWPQDLDERMLFAIVGSRHADAVGCQIAFEFGQRLAQGGVCIVSGLALGVDTMAHRGALESGSGFPTVAVLGSGLNVIYPTPNVKLAKEILSRGGVLLSQFEPEVKPLPYNFLNRNQIIAGMSCGVLVIQAAKKSGALATVRYGLEQGREIFVVPGGIKDSRYEGSNSLLKQGAVLTTSVEDIYEVLPQLNGRLAAECRSHASESLSEEQQRILKIIATDEKVHNDKLLQKFDDKMLLARNLLELELKGLIRRLPGNNLILIKPN